MEEIINTCEYYKICESACGGTLEDTELCSCYQLYKQLKRLEQENKILQELKDEDSLRVVQLAKENAELKERKDKYYQRTLDLEIVVSEYQQALEEIRGFCKCSKEPMDCKKCPMSEGCEELCVNDENLQDIIINQINEVLND